MVKQKIEKARAQASPKYEPIDVYRDGYNCQGPKHLNPWFHQQTSPFFTLWRKGWEDRFYAEKEQPST